MSLMELDEDDGDLVEDVETPRRCKYLISPLPVFDGAALGASVRMLAAPRARGSCMDRLAAILNGDATDPEVSLLVALDCLRREEATARSGGGVVRSVVLSVLAYVRAEGLATRPPKLPPRCSSL